MKKTLLIGIILAMIVLPGCNRKTRYEDLPQETQKTIQADIKKEIFTPYLQKTLDMTSGTGQSGGEKKSIIDNNIKELKNNFKAFLAKKYPNIDFTLLLEKSENMK